MRPFTPPWPRRLAALGLTAAVALMPVATQPEASVPPVAPAVAPTPAATPRQAGALEGLEVYLSQGHGYVAHSTGRGWQRPLQHGLREDVWTARFSSEWLVPALERAGAMVHTPRERDLNAVRVLADDSDPSFRSDDVRERRIGGDWALHQPDLAAARALASHSVLEPGGRASYTLTAPETGSFVMYAAWSAHPEADANARFTVTSESTRLSTRVDQRRTERWWPLGRVDVVQGETVTVWLDGSGSGLPVAGTVRLGGGVVSVEDTRDGEVVALPAWQVASIHQLRYHGAPEAVAQPVGGGFAGDASARARWADWAHDVEGDAVYISLHTDAGGGQGTTAFVRRRCWTEPCDAEVAASETLADALRSAVVSTGRRWNPDWVDRGTRQAALAEVNTELNPGMPATLLELAFHDDPGDAALLADPAFRAEVADALVAGLLRWYRPGAPLPPAPPVQVEFAAERASWRAAAFHPDHDPAEGWRIRQRGPDGNWQPATWSPLPEVTVASDVFAIEVAGVNSAGVGRPQVFERHRDAVADSTPPQ